MAKKKTVKESPDQLLKIKPLSNMERLAIAQTNIFNLKAELKKWQDEHEAALAGILQNATFAEDPFLAAIKKSGESYREGDFKLLRQPKTVRSIIAEKFMQTFPDIGVRICTIPIGKAEALIGKANIGAFCEKKTSYSYEVIDMGTAHKITGRA